MREEKSSRASGFHSQKTTKHIRVQALGLRVSGFGFRVSGFGFRVSGVWLRRAYQKQPIAGESIQSTTQVRADEQNSSGQTQKGL